MSAIAHCSEDVAQVVAYEIAAFDRLCSRLKLAYTESDSFIPEEFSFVGTSHTDDDTWTLSAELESLLVHTRVLREFFYYYWDFDKQQYKARKKKRHDDDVIAEDFIPDWSDSCPAIGQYLSDHKRRLDKSLAHLSTLRVYYKQIEKRWNLHAIHSELLQPIDRFKERLPARMSNWFVPKRVEAD